MVAVLSGPSEWAALRKAIGDDFIRYPTFIMFASVRVSCRITFNLREHTFLGSGIWWFGWY